MSHIAVFGGGLVSWILILLASGAVGDWPQWRGPQRDGQAVGFRIPASWPDELRQVWQFEVGEGHSSPVAVDGKIYILSRRDENEVLTCLSTVNGKELWSQSYPAPYQVNPTAVAHGKGPKSTPAVASGKVFTFGISGILACWDAKTGKRQWKKDFAKTFENTSPLYGSASSPVVDGEKCVVHVGGHDKGALVALDIKNGQLLWSCPDDGPGYASPVVATLENVRQVVTLTQKACIGVNFESGKLLWKIPFSTEYDQNAVTPLVREGSVIVSGYNKGMDRFRIEQQDGEWEADNIWDNKEVSLYLSSPVADAERLFGFSQRQKGQLFAIDLTTGKVLWTSEGRMGENAAVVQTGGVLWALTTEAQLIVFQANDKQFQQLARYKVAESPTWAHPVFVPGGILIKDETKLTLWQIPKPQ